RNRVLRRRDGRHLVHRPVPGRRGGNDPSWPDHAGGRFARKRFRYRGGRRLCKFALAGDPDVWRPYHRGVTAPAPRCPGDLRVTVFAVVYLALHPDDPWTFVSLVVLGVGLAWLTWRTGGLEAAICLHLDNSLVQYTLYVPEGRISEIGTGAVVGSGLPTGAGSLLGLGLTTFQVVLYVGLVTSAARRRGVLWLSPWMSR